MFENIILFLFSFVLTWTIGLTPPLLIRFVLFKKPMNKFWAIYIAFIFWLINLSIWIGPLKSTSKTHHALVIVGIISYYILKRVNENTNKESENQDNNENQSSLTNE